MVKIIKCEDKTEEEALKKCSQAIGEDINNFFYRQKEIEGTLFKGKRIEVSAISKKEVIEYIKEYIKNISKLMNIDIKSEVNEKDEVINITLVSSNNAIMIGKEGKTLNALQLMLRQSLRNITNFNIKLNLDVSNYKNKKLKNLEQEIIKIVNDVINTKIDVKLDPMNSYERRFVHTIVSKYPKLSTVSEGDEPNRYVKITYKK